MSSKKLKVIFEYLSFAVFLLFICLGFLEFTGRINIFQDSQKQTLALQSAERTMSRVYIAGAVKNPGVYEISDGMLLVDLVEKAGGFVGEVDLEKIHKSINLASRVFHQDHVYIPFVYERVGNNEALSSPVVQVETGKIDLNTASQSELEILPGVGPATAQKIIDSRPYSNISDLLKVKGIGDATYDKLKDLVSI
jgi:competence protein ComEA